MKYSPQSSYLIYSSSHILTIFFFVVRRLKIYPLKNLKYTTQYSSLHIRALGHQSYITETLYPWVTFPHSPLLPAFGNHHSSLPFYEFVDVTYKWGHTIFVFVWLISLSVMSSRFIHAIANDRIFSFLKAEESIVWRYNPSLFFFNPFSHSWTFRLFPCLGYRKQCWNELESANISLRTWFHFLWS